MKYLGICPCAKERARHGSDDCIYAVLNHDAKLRIFCLAHSCLAISKTKLDGRSFGAKNANIVQYCGVSGLPGYLQ